MTDVTSSGDGRAEESSPTHRRRMVTTLDVALSAATADAESGQRSGEVRWKAVGSAGRRRRPLTMGVAPPAHVTR